MMPIYISVSNYHITENPKYTVKLSENTYSGIVNIKQIDNDITNATEKRQTASLSVSAIKIAFSYFPVTKVEIIETNDVIAASTANCSGVYNLPNAG